ncbi:UDP-N-acetylmuramoyl-tripeptide--D-alanyl-D-alanine ligase [bacterium]|nr:UDP-N-acetylmuramoyl-tripeptide--D-alanyl-D-alanine ligase [bacterium]
MFTTLLIEKALEKAGLKKKLKNAVISKCCIDSRECTENSLFFAFKGEKTDGHNYVPDLLEKGVICIGSEDISESENYIKVPDVLDFMSILAHERRLLFNGRVIAVTGSSGKTSTRQLIASMAAVSGKIVWATTGNLNNHLGMPLVIMNMPLGTEVLVLEMGMNHSGEIRKLVEIADPDFVTITNIGNAHIGNFASHADLAAAKLEIFNFSKAVVSANISDPYMKSWVDEHKNSRNIHTYSNDELKGLSEDFDGLPDFMVENINCAANIVSAALGTLPDLKKAVEKCVLPGMRGEVKVIGKRTFVVDCYNANPQSMQRSIENFYKKYALKESKQCVLILGSMFELGNFSEKMHKELVNSLKNFTLLKAVFLVGCEFDKIKSDFWNCKKLVFLGDISDIKGMLPEEGVFLVKGSRGNRLERLFDFPEVLK